VIDLKANTVTKMILTTKISLHMATTSCTKPWWPCDAWGFMAICHNIAMFLAVLIRRTPLISKRWVPDEGGGVSFRALTIAGYQLPDH